MRKAIPALSLFAALLALLPSSIQAQQPWRPAPASRTSDKSIPPSQEPTPRPTPPTLNEALQTFQTWMDTVSNRSAHKGWKQYGRWLWFNESRTPNDGSVAEASRHAQAYVRQTLEEQGQRTAGGGSWDNFGFPVPMNVSRTGRINCMAWDPIDPLGTLYIGAPDGGIWVSSDSARGTWAPLSDQIASIGVSSIAIDPVTPTTLYIATGDRDGNITDLVSPVRSVGVLKSTDAGFSWNTTGLNWTVDNPALVGKVIVDRAAPNNVIATTTTGIHRSTDGGTTWPSAQPGSFRDLIQDKTTSTRWYATTGNGLYYSTDNGASWNAGGSGLPGSATRIVLAVTLANPNYVYALATNSNGGDLGVHRSTDMGLSFTPRTGIEDTIVAWQGNYNLAIEASDTDAEIVYAAGVILCKTTDGGTSWRNLQCNGVDLHDIWIGPRNEVWACTDQGLYRTNTDGFIWSTRNYFLDIWQHYRMGVGQGPDIVATTGTQDNGINYHVNDFWYSGGGGDGTGAAVDQLNSNYLYAADYNTLRRSTNRGTNWTSATAFNSVSETANWILPITTDHLVAGTVYSAKCNVFKSTDYGVSWNPISSFTPNYNDRVIRLRVAPSSSSHVYSLTREALKRTTNGGTSWQNITANLDNGAYLFSDVWVHHTNPDIIWVSISGYDPALKVWKTTDGGTSWTNISSGLPNIPANAGIHYPGTAGDIFLGTDDGVFLFDHATSTWYPHRDYMPRAIVTDLAFDHHWSRLYAATFGRGGWFSQEQVTTINELASAEPLKLTAYLHPNTGQWILRYALGKAAKGRLRVLDLRGVVLYEIPLSTREGEIRDFAAGWANGLYLLHVETTYSSKTTKILVRN